MIKTNKQSNHNFHNNITGINSQILKLKKELILLKVKQKTKQKVKPHLIKKTKHKISQIFTSKQ
uniref:Ribosomal protein L29 n=1 Tax=Bostrychia tenella TaxID=324755 RepID=A0A1Z1M5V9_9FLOR|nr:ribosomal protein L29 [Bostrychia tenella]ARW61292.1 ribosomal protein L29 [Bostrychia tenella]